MEANEASLTNTDAAIALIEQERMRRILAIVEKVRSTHMHFESLSQSVNLLGTIQNAAGSSPSSTPHLARPVVVPHAKPVSSSSSSSTPITNETVIVRGAVAQNVLKLMHDTNLVPLTWLPSLTLRVLPFRDYELKWGDLRLEDNTWRSRLTLKQLLRCGVNVTDLWACGLARTFAALKDVFSFHPRDVSINYKLFNLGRLRELYGVTYQELALDFSMGIYEYLIDLRLPLADIHSAGISADMMVEWRTSMTSLFVQHGLPDPDTRRINDPVTQRFFSNLTFDLFAKRVKLCHDELKDWITFLGLRAEHLIKMGATRDQLLALWKHSYKSIDHILDELQALPDERKQL